MVAVAACGPLNQAPTAADVAIAPNPATVEDDLRCEITVESIDPDGDTVEYLYDWWVDGAQLGVIVATDPASVPAAQTREDEEWECIVTPTDSVEEGPSASDTVTVGPA